MIGAVLLTIIPAKECPSQAEKVVVPAIQGETYYVEAKGDYIQLYRNESYVKFTQKFTAIEVLCRVSESARNAHFKPIMSAETESSFEQKSVNSNDWEWIRFEMSGESLTLSLSNDQNTPIYDINIDVKSVAFFYENTVEYAQYKLKWNYDNIVPADGFVIYAGDKSGKEGFLESYSTGETWEKFYQARTVIAHTMIYTVDWPKDKPFYAVVTAFNSTGESEPSNEVFSDPGFKRPPAPNNLKLERIK